MMTGADFRATRELLGLDRETIATYLHVKPQLVRQWDQGASRVPVGVESELRALKAKADDRVANLIDEVASGRRIIQIPKGPGGSFARMIAARVLWNVDAEVEYSG